MCNDNQFPKMKITDFSDINNRYEPCPGPGPRPCPGPGPGPRPCHNHDNCCSAPFSDGGLISINGNINLFLSLFSDDTKFPFNEDDCCDDKCCDDKCCFE